MHKAMSTHVDLFYYSTRIVFDRLNKEKRYNLAVPKDPLKGFSTINHNLLKAKLNIYGFNRLTLLEKSLARNENKHKLQSPEKIVFRSRSKVSVWVTANQHLPE